MKNKLRHITKTLRGKLSLWYLTSVGLIMITFLSVTGFLFWFTLQDQIDHHVHIAVNEASGIVQNYSGEERDKLLKNLVSAQGMTIIVLSPDGAPVLETNSPDVALVTEHQLQKIMTSSSLFQAAPVHFTESNIRFAAMPVQISAGKGILAVGYSTQVLYATFMRMILVVTGIVIFLVFPITYLGYKLLKQQLQPLESVAEQASKVSSSSSLSKRIAISTATEEITTIQKAFNTMLSQLEQVFATERQFFSDAAHTLKTPIAVLRSQIETSRLSNKSQHELLTTIDSATDTIQDLLFLAKIETHAHHSTRFSISELMTTLTELATSLGEEKKLRVTSRIATNVYVNGDRKLLLRALSNIVHNAVIYNRYEGVIHIALKKKSGRVIIQIVDSGVGISKRDQKQLFTRFFRGSNAAGAGTGLGLAITKSALESSSGTIKILSTPGKGSEVRISLPLSSSFHV